jgi:hypothetical protein
MLQYVAVPLREVSKLAGVIANPTGEVVAKLEASWPDWQFWTVPRAVGGTLWCARRWDDPKRVLHARGPDELVERLKAEMSR